MFHCLARETYTDRAGRTYSIGMENAEWTYPEFEQLYRTHYAEMCKRLAEQGIDMPPYNPNLEGYCRGARQGTLLHFTVRHEGAPVGYCNIWITSDAHNSQLIAREDTIFVAPEHRAGVGSRLCKYMLAELKRRDVWRLHVTTATDPRATLMWERIGFKPVGAYMMYVFK